VHVHVRLRRQAPLTGQWLLPLLLLVLLLQPPAPHEPLQHSDPALHLSFVLLQRWHLLSDPQLSPVLSKQRGEDGQQTASRTPQAHSQPFVFLLSQSTKAPAHLP